MSLLTNILGPIMPDLVRSFDLSLTTAAMLPFSFFIAYGVISVPAGVLAESISIKGLTAGSFLLSFFGALLFVLYPSYWTAIPSLFVIGSGMAMLQVVLNPLLRIAGGEEHFAFNSALAQVIFGAASFLSPRLYSSLVGQLSEKGGSAHAPWIQALSAVVPHSLPWLSMYWLFVPITLAMLLVIAVLRLPASLRSGDEQKLSWQGYKTLLRRPLVVLYFLGIFAYVGSEQGVADWMSQFLLTRHGYDPRTDGASAVSWYWGFQTLGCVAALPLLKLFDSRRVLIAAAMAAMACLTAAIWGPAQISLWAFPSIGFFASVIWPVTVSLALNSVHDGHGALTGILCVGIAGGAVVPLAIGSLADHLGLAAGLSLLYLAFGWSFALGFWARPIISNKIVSFST